MYEVYEKRTRKLFEAYFHKLMPRLGEVSTQTIEKLKAVKAAAATKSPSSAQFQKDVQDGIELLERQQLARAATPSQPSQ